MVGKNPSSTIFCGIKRAVWELEKKKRFTSYCNPELHNMFPWPITRKSLLLQIFGAYCSTSWAERNRKNDRGMRQTYFGTGETFLFSFPGMTNQVSSPNSSNDIFLQKDLLLKIFTVSFTCIKSVTFRNRSLIGTVFEGALPPLGSHFRTLKTLNWYHFSSATLILVSFVFKCRFSINSLVSYSDHEKRSHI